MGSCTGRCLPLLIFPFVICFHNVRVLAWYSAEQFEHSPAITNASASEHGRLLLQQIFPGSQVVGTEGLMLPLTAQHNVARGRGLLRSGILPVSGSIKEMGYYYATVSFGTPSRHFDLIIDTGSTITYVPCSDCGNKCGKHEAAAFDPKKSSTAKVLGCAPHEPKCNCGSPRCTCLKDQCYFSRSYAEGSSSQGVLVEDVFTFPDTSGKVISDSSVRMVFGCEEGETGEIFRQRADGLIGMGDNDNSFLSQLVRMGAITDSFSLCLGHPDGGTMLLGDVEFPGSENMLFTPLLKKPGVHYYTLSLNEVTVGGRKVNVASSMYAQGYGTVLDSGTTFLYLPSAAFNSFVQLVKDAASKSKLEPTGGPDPRFKDICWKKAPTDPSKLHTVFPVVEMVFAGGAVLKLQPLQYLFQYAPVCYCLGVFDNYNAGTLVGDIAVRNVVTKYDRRNKRVGFLSVESCEAAKKAISSTSPTEASQPPNQLTAPSPSPSLPLSPTAPTQLTLPSPPSPGPDLGPSPQPDLDSTSQPADTGTEVDRDSDDGNPQNTGSDGRKVPGDRREGDGSQSGYGNDWKSVVIPVLMCAVLVIVGGAAYVYKGALVAQYNQMRTMQAGQEMVSPSTLYTQV